MSNLVSGLKAKVKNLKYGMNRTDVPLLQVSDGFSFVENGGKTVVGEDVWSDLSEDPMTTEVPDDRTCT